MTNHNFLGTYEKFFCNIMLYMWCWIRRVSNNIRLSLSSEVLLESIVFHSRQSLKTFILWFFSKLWLIASVWWTLHYHSTGFVSVHFHVELLTKPRHNVKKKLCWQYMGRIKIYKWFKYLGNKEKISVLFLSPAFTISLWKSSEG